MTTDDTRPLPSGEEAFDAAIQRAFADTGKAVRTTFTPQDDDLKFQTDLAYARGFKAGHEAAAPTPDPLPLDPEDHGHTGRLWCDPCVAHGVMLEQGVHRCANTVSSGNGITSPDPLREALHAA